MKFKSCYHKKNSSCDNVMRTRYTTLQYLLYYFLVTIFSGAQKLTLQKKKGLLMAVTKTAAKKYL